MKLEIYIPSERILSEEVEKIVAEDTSGSFCLLPHHIDCVRVIVPTILKYAQNNQEKYVGIDEGILIKCKDTVRLSTKNAIHGADLGSMKGSLEKDLEKIDEDEKKVRVILTELEVDFIKRYTAIKRNEF